MSSRSDSARYCSVCPRWHLVDGRMCNGCYAVQCIYDKTWTTINPDAATKCEDCNREIQISERVRQMATHPANMIICPRCQHRLRLKPRDKKRHRRLKANTGDLIVPMLMPGIMKDILPPPDKEHPSLPR